MDPASGANKQPGLSASFPNIAEVCGLLAAGLGLTALFGWLTDTPILTTFASETIPMTPSTAFFFLCYGLGGARFLLRASPGRPSRWAAIALGFLGLLTVSLLFILSLQGIRPNIEHLGFAVSGTVADSPIGHMSPLTAFCFILAGTAFLLAMPASPRYFWLVTAAFWFAASVSLFSLAMLLAYLLGAPLLYGSSVIPPALPTSLALLLLGLSLQLAIWSRATTRKTGDKDSRTSYHLLLIFFLLTVGIILVGYLLFQKHEKEYEHGMRQQLSAIATLKAEQIADWLSERRADATELASNLPLARRVDKFLYHGAAAEGDNIASRLESMRFSHGYDGIALLDNNNRPVFQQGDPIAQTGPAQKSIAEARDGGRIVESSLFRDKAGKIHLIWVAPIMTEGEHGQKHMATVLLSTRAETFLFPFLEEWPSASRSAETLLVRRDGDEVLFLNNLRFKRDAALNLRFPLRQATLPAAQATMGREGLFMGRDYRGVPVQAALKAVPGSPWFLVARMDLAEIQTPLRDRLWSMVMVILALLAGAGATLLLQLQRQRHELLSQMAEKDRLLAIELEKLVAERTAQLDDANKELESFSYSVSHDLKAPLRGIDGYSRLLEEDYRERLDAEGRTFLANIRQGVAQMHQLIEDLLAYSRMERRILSNVPVNLPALVRAVADEVAAEQADCGGALHMVVPGLNLAADRDGLAMALRNLLDNACKFSRDAQPPIIEIGARPENGKAIVWVRDNGIGFDQKFHERIFEIFNRLEKAEDFPGTGVGLALVRKAMLRMGGRVWAESEPGRGAVFYLELPLAAPAVSDEQSEQPDIT